MQSMFSSVHLFSFFFYSVALLVSFKEKNEVPFKVKPNLLNRPLIVQRLVQKKLFSPHQFTKSRPFPPRKNPNEKRQHKQPVEREGWGWGCCCVKVKSEGCAKAECNSVQTGLQEPNPELPVGVLG